MCAHMRRFFVHLMLLRCPFVIFVLMPSYLSIQVVDRSNIFICERSIVFFARFAYARSAARLIHHFCFVRLFCVSKAFYWDLLRYYLAEKWCKIIKSWAQTSMFLYRHDFRSAITLFVLCACHFHFIYLGTLAFVS